MNIPDLQGNAAVYLVGHGPCREPRPIELQWMRILRYYGLLIDSGARLEIADPPFIDLNYPRGTPLREKDNYASLHQLSYAIENKAFSHVFIDLAPPPASFIDNFGWIEHWLKKAGAHVINVNDDSEKVFEEHLSAAYQGQAHIREITDGSDFVAFFPALSAEIATAALRRLRPYPAERPHTLGTVWRELDELHSVSPYRAGREPFLQPELQEEWFERVRAFQEGERRKRRECEQLFRLAPSMPGKLLDEDRAYDREPRTPAELQWAESRILATLGFKKSSEGRVISYIRDLDSFRVFADIRTKPRIHFYVYQSPRDDKMATVSHLSFALHDQFSRKLEERWQAEFGALVSRSKL